MSTLIAAAQMQSSGIAEENLAKAEAAIRIAAARGAKLIVFPEIFMTGFPPADLKAELVRKASQPLDGPFVRGLSAAARQAGLWVISGMLETAEADAKAYNTTVVLNAQGELVTFYRKTHLFDAFGFKESDAFATGDKLFEPLETPFGRMGLFVCYELRFPEVARYQAERGVDFFIMPSGWVNGSMKEVHWRHLIVARAIENTAYMITSDQTGDKYLGRSLLVDPMGVVLAEGSEGEDLIYADINLERVAEVRGKVPSVAHRRSELYR
ncbi:carbon-nitrogen hydrolase family protein [Ktedonosporobacter rubrisoli]|uniref:Carbon-nitrogen hydrolase family protein n=1 Tax=Ktedonosporobacter rubrisoli TaxID=2509675 RepID=A0A4P6K462_KTERU|nr:carbon-nitrogen hydrolase family protein [Ktedonosporobacter rubrisoli]QBD83088.1 carbon-nitrogen hydrolase family protein [Ktedonosporobacter rubrisoli]